MHTSFWGGTKMQTDANGRQTDANGGKRKPTKVKKIERKWKIASKSEIKQTGVRSCKWMFNGNF